LQQLPALAAEGSTRSPSTVSSLKRSPAIRSSVFVWGQRVMGLVIAAQPLLHVLANRTEEMEIT